VSVCGRRGIAFVTNNGHRIILSPNNYICGCSRSVLNRGDGDTICLLTQTKLYFPNILVYKKVNLFTSLEMKKSQIKSYKQLAYLAL